MIWLLRTSCRHWPFIKMTDTCAILYQPSPVSFAHLLSKLGQDSIPKTWSAVTFCNDAGRLRTWGQATIFNSSNEMRYPISSDKEANLGKLYNTRAFKAVRLNKLSGKAANSGQVRTYKNARELRCWTRSPSPKDLSLSQFMIPRPSRG